MEDLGKCSYYFQPMGQFSEGRVCGLPVVEKIGPDSVGYCGIHIEEMKKNLENPTGEHTSKD